MSKQTTIIVVIAVALVLVILMIIKNKRDRKKLITPEDGNDPVQEQNMEHHNHRDKL